jgi:hypothetical protein
MEKARHLTLQKARKEDLQIAQPEQTLDPIQQFPLSSEQQRTLSSDRYTDEGLHPQTRCLRIATNAPFYIGNTQIHEDLGFLFSPTTSGH